MTDAELTLLSLLATDTYDERELDFLIESRGFRRWAAIGHASLTMVIDKLVRQGLIEHIAASNRYRISTAGMGVLQTAVTDRLSTPHRNDREFGLGLANLHVLKPAQVLAALNGRRQSLRDQIKRLTVEYQTVKDDFQIAAMHHHTITMMEAELVWLAEFAESCAQHLNDLQETPPEAPVVSEDVRARQVILPQDSDSPHKRRTKVIPSPQRGTPTGYDTQFTPGKRNKPDES